MNRVMKTRCLTIHDTKKRGDANVAGRETDLLRDHAAAMRGSPQPETCDL